MTPDDVDYYRQRAATERELARRSENADVALIHEELAIQYEALVAESGLRPTLHIAARRAAPGLEPGRAVQQPSTRSVVISCRLRSIHS